MNFPISQSKKPPTIASRTNITEENDFTFSTAIIPREIKEKILISNQRIGIC
jgi:hypothetical protein